MLITLVDISADAPCSLAEHEFPATPEKGNIIVLANNTAYEVKNVIHALKSNVAGSRVIACVTSHTLTKSDLEALGIAGR